MENEDDEVFYDKNPIEEIYKDKLRQNFVEETNKEITENYDKELLNEEQINQEDDFDEPLDKEQTKNEEIKENQTKDDEKIDEKQTKDDKTIDEKQLNNSFEEMYRKTFGVNPVENGEVKDNKLDDKIEIKVTDIVEPSECESGTNSINYKFIGIVFSTYIAVEIENEMYLINQSSACEKIIFENLKRNYYSSGNKEAQMMLLPDVIELTSKQMDIAMDNIPVLKKAGFEYEEFGENTIKLSGVPDICIDLETKDLFVKILDEINKVARTSTNEIEEKFLATIAKRVARNERKATTFEEIDTLMKKLLSLKKPFEDSNGKPIAVKLSKSEIEKKI